VGLALGSRETCGGEDEPTLCWSCTDLMAVDDPSLLSRSSYKINEIDK